MKGIRNLFLAGCSLVLLCQCASQDEIRELNYQIRAVNQKVEEIKSSTVSQMQKRQASSVSKLDQLDAEILRLNSLIEENAHQNRQFIEQSKDSFSGLRSEIVQLRTDIAAQKTETEKKIHELSIKVDQLAATIEQIQKARIRAAEERARAAARKAEEARRRSAAVSSGKGVVRLSPEGRKVRISEPKVVNAVPEKKETAPPPAVKAAEEKKTVSAESASQQNSSLTSGDPFDKGMELFKKKQYKEAYHHFEQVLAANPPAAKAAQTLFYMGECLFNQGEYDLAILDYQKVISNHAKDPHTPSALLKQGMSFEKLTDNETAKIIYKKLIAEYPDATEAAMAKERLGKL